MLEYMLARAEDQPIIEKSNGKLRWIVLDEAHSLVGAAAAETALLIRRVLLAFNTAPENVHFVATSATIGDDRDTDDKLRQFLAEVAGICSNGASVLATVSGNGHTMAWATHSASSRYPGIAWGQPAEGSIFRGTIQDTASTNPISPSELLPQSTAKVLLIEKNLDRSMSLFGTGMAGLIRTNLANLGFEVDAAISRIEYKDPYVRSPLVSKLLIDTAAALFKSSTSPVLKITTAPPKVPVSPPKHISNDWPDGHLVSSVQAEYGRLKNIDVQVSLGDCGHGRFMELSFTDGRAATVIFDQGFGAWTPTVRDSRTLHDFTQTPYAQASSMQKSNPMLARKGVWPTYVVLRAG